MVSSNFTPLFFTAVLRGHRPCSRAASSSLRAPWLAGQLSYRLPNPLALGLKTITPLGTADENALAVTVEPQKLIVAPELGFPTNIMPSANVAVLVMVTVVDPAVVF